MGCSIRTIIIFVVIVLAIIFIPNFCETTPSTEVNVEDKTTSQSRQSINIIPLRSSDGDRVSLVYNQNAHDPTWDELLWFLRSENTDALLYDYNFFVCSDFAERLQNNSEQASIKCGFVSIDFMNKPSGHACNAYNTTDKGIVYIDCTGEKTKIPQNTYNDRIVAGLKSGANYSLVDFNYRDLTEYQILNTKYQVLNTKYQALDTKYQSLSGLYWARVTSKKNVVGTLTYKKLEQEGVDTKIQMDELSKQMDELSKQMDEPVKQMDALKVKWGFDGYQRQYYPVGITESFTIYWPE